MASQLSPTPAETRSARPADYFPPKKAERCLLVAGLGNPVSLDYVEYLSRHGEAVVAVVTDADSRDQGPDAAWRTEEIEELVLFLKPRLSEADRRRVDDLLATAGAGGARFLCVVSTFRAHLGDHDATEAEEYVLARAAGLGVGSTRPPSPPLPDSPPTGEGLSGQSPGGRTVVFRPGHVLSPRSRPSGWLGRLGPCHPLVPGWLCGPCVAGEELFAAIERERHEGRGSRPRVFTLLGPSRSWRELLRAHRGRGLRPGCLTVLSFALALLLVGRLAGLLLGLLARRRPAWRQWHVGTLRPGSLSELLTLVNPYNCRHVKVVGYNNGVVHFGHRYPAKTIVSAVCCDRLERVAPDEIKADCGVTVRGALDFLAGDGQDLYVIPNYSYVCLGTAFFVPIHGSAVAHSCVADTITRVVLYDPGADRLIVAGRDEPGFREHVYRMDAGVLLLRLYLRVKEKARYHVHREELDGPTSAEVLAAFRDGRATNVEVRKSRASGSRVQIHRYFKDAEDAGRPVLELPRDSLGRLWDRLEENPVTSWLLHTLTRTLAWHVELFFTAEEFAAFWEGHRSLPLKKIQLRTIRRDGMPHSPFRDHDCVSADMFMLRRHRQAFEAYLRQNFPVVRVNPGKHSR